MASTPTLAPLCVKAAQREGLLWTHLHRLLASPHARRLFSLVGRLPHLCPPWSSRRPEVNDFRRNPVFGTAISANADRGGLADANEGT